jgi:hypothetical protein
MKINFLTLILALLSLTSCKSQETGLDRGRTTAYVIEVTEKGCIASTDTGKDLVIDGKLEVNVEYDMVYDILSRNERVIRVKLIHAEHSERENLKRRVALAKLLRK